MRGLFKPILGGCVGLAIGISVAMLLPERAEPASITFLSVGQGDCAVFQSDGKTVLIDVGPAGGIGANQSLAVRALRQMGVDTVDLILLSHPDLDHIGGLDGIRRNFKIGAIAISAAYRNDPNLLSSFKSMGVDPAGVSWMQGPLDARLGSSQIHVETPIWHEGEPDNEGSMFVKVSSGGAAAVFSGDANMITELTMMGRYDWRAQVLKVGHHGSQFSTSDRWLSTVHPEVAVISCGRNNRYGHPHPNVLQRLKNAGVKFYRTDQDGDVRFELANGKFEPVAQ